MLASEAAHPVLILTGEILNNLVGMGGLVCEQSFGFFLLVLTKHSQQAEGRVG